MPISMRYLWRSLVRILLATAATLALLLGLAALVFIRQNAGETEAVAAEVPVAPGA